MTTSPASSTATTSPARPRDHCQLHSHVPAGRPASSARAARDVTLPRPFEEAPALAFQFQSQELTAVAVRSRAVASSPCHVHVHSQITRPAGPGRSRSGPATVTMSAVSTESSGHGDCGAAFGVRLALLRDLGRGAGTCDPNRDGRVAYAVLLRGRVPDAGTTRVGDGRRVVEAALRGPRPRARRRERTRPCCPRPPAKRSPRRSSRCRPRPPHPPCPKPSWSGSRRRRRPGSRPSRSRPCSRHPPALRPLRRSPAAEPRSRACRPSRRGCLRSGVGLVLLDDRGPVPRLVDAHRHPVLPTCS